MRSLFFFIHHSSVPSAEKEEFGNDSIYLMFLQMIADGHGREDRLTRKGETVIQQIWVFATPNGHFGE